MSNSNFVPQEGFHSRYPQRFNLPTPILKIIITHWSSNLYQKMIQTCKDFFFHHRAVVIHNYSSHGTYENAKNGYIAGNFFEHYYVEDISQIKLWITGNYYLYEERQVTPKEMNQFYRFELTVLDVSHQKLNVLYFLVMSRYVSYLSLKNTEIFNPHRENLTVCDIIALMPNLIKFKINSYKLGPIKKLRKTLNVPPIKNSNFEFMKFTSKVDPIEFCEMVKLFPGIKFKVNFDHYTQDERDPFSDVVHKAFPEGEIEYEYPENDDDPEYENVWSLFMPNNTEIHLKISLK